MRDSYRCECQGRFGSPFTLEQTLARQCSFVEEADRRGKRMQRIDHVWIGRVDRPSFEGQNPREMLGRSKGKNEARNGRAPGVVGEF